LHDGPGAEPLHDDAASRLDLRGRLAHFHPRDSFDLLPQRGGGVGKKLPLKYLHFGGAGRTFGQDPFGQRQGVVHRDDQRAFTQDHGHRLGDAVARPLLIESDCRLGDLFCNSQLGGVYRVPPSWLQATLATASEKKADVAQHPRVFDHVGLLVIGPPGTAELPFS
jgi:hypothetical protein